MRKIIPALKIVARVFFTSFFISGTSLFFIGLVDAFLRISANHYFACGLYRLGILEVMRAVNRWAAFYPLVFALAAAAAAAVYRVFLPGIAVFRLRSKKKLAAFFSAAFFFAFAGWTINHFFLPDKFAPVSLAVDAALAALSAALYRVLAAMRWKDILRLYGAAKNTVFSFVIFLNVWMLADGKFNKPPGPNVLLISADTLRHDMLGVNGCPRQNITPHLDAFAGDAVNFKTCVSQSPWTLPSHVSMMTSLYPDTHGMDLFGRSFPDMVLDPAVVTLAEELRDRNYITLALTGGRYVHSKFGFAQGFMLYENDTGRLESGVSVLMEFLKALKGRKFFVFFHTYHTHAPYKDARYLRELVDAGKVHPAKRNELVSFLYRPGMTFASQREKLIKLGLYNKDVSRVLYESGVSSLDEQMGRLFAFLRKEGFLDNTIVIFTSDHGEEFGEHDKDSFYGEHAIGLYDELIRVPLLVRMPGFGNYGGRVVTAQAATIDIMPTILDLLGIHPCGMTEGESLLGLLSGDDPGARAVFSSVNTHDCSMRSVRLPRYKYIRNYIYRYEPSDEALFDLKEDPGEERDARKTEPELAADMRDALNEFVRAHARYAFGGGAALSRKVDNPELRRELRALGYLQ